MIRIQLALLQREIWEHRSLYLTPVVIALVVTLTALTGNISIGEMEHVDLGIVGASNMPDNARAAALTVGMLLLSSIFVLAMAILTVFFTLDSLYAERKDRSILFWRSIPLTDFETVLSKLLTAVLLIPLVTFALILLTHIVVLLITSVGVTMRGGDAWHLIWSAAPIFDNWTAILVLLLRYRCGCPHLSAGFCLCQRWQNDHLCSSRFYPSRYYRCSRKYSSVANSSSRRFSYAQSKCHCSLDWTI